MSKISEPELIESPSGDETVVVLKDGVTRRSGIDAIAAAAVAPQVERTEEAAQRAEFLTHAFNVETAIDDDGLIAHRIDEAGRVIEGEYADGRTFNPALFPDTGMADDGLIATLISDDLQPRVLAGHYADGTSFPRGDGPLFDLVYPNDGRLNVSDHAGIAERSAYRLRFERPLDDFQGFQHCAPGARVCFHSKARAVRFALFFNNRVIRQDTHDPDAVLLVDGERFANFTSTTGPGQTQQLERVVAFDDASLRRFDLLWPYGAGMELMEIGVERGAGLAFADRPLAVDIVGGDSIVQGYTGADAYESWAQVFGRARGNRTINGGYGGRQAVASDGDWIGSLAAPHGALATLVYVIGVNNCIAQTPLVAFRAEIDGWLVAARAQAPLARIVLVSPFYCPAIEANPIPLDAYRAEIEAASLASADANLLFVHGKPLMTNSPDRMVGDLIHPNALGMAEAGAGLAAALA